MNTPALSSRQIYCFAGVLLLGACWLAMTRYQGFFQDARLYSMLALYRLHPANFHTDLFVAAGSQDGFTIFPVLYAGLIQGFNLDTAAFILTSCAQLLWFLALLLVLRRITSGWPLVAALACVVYCSRFYEPYYMFAYAESFPTPRIYAEAMSLLALHAILGRGYLRAALFCVMGILFHPLIIAYAALLSFLCFLADTGFDRRWRFGLLALAVIGGVALLAMQVQPFANLLRSYDAEWWNVFAVSTPSAVFPSDWSRGAALRVVYLILPLLMAWWHDVPVIGKKMPVFLGGALLLIMTWVIGTQYGHNLLITQLQLWRCIWVLQVLSLIVQGILMLDLWRQGGADRWLAAIMLTALLQLGFNTQDGSFACALLLAGLVLHALLRRIPPARLNRSPWHLLPALFPLPLLLLNALRAWDFRAARLLATNSAEVSQALVWAMAGVCLGILLLFVIRKKLEKVPRGALLAPLVALACLAVATCIWSRPFINADSSFNPEQAKMIARLQQRIPPGSVIYSNNSVLWAWFVLQRSYYIDRYQMSGDIFSRVAAVEGFRRMIFLCQVGVAGCPASNFKDESLENPDAFWAARTGKLCSDPTLDFLVLQGADVPGKTNEILRTEGDGEVLTIVDCHQSRAANGTQAAPIQNIGG